MNIGFKCALQIQLAGIETTTSSDGARWTSPPPAAARLPRNTTPLRTKHRAASTANYQGASTHSFTFARRMRDAALHRGVIHYKYARGSSCGYGPVRFSDVDGLRLETRGSKQLSSRVKAAAGIDQPCGGGVNDNNREPLPASWTSTCTTPRGARRTR